jgi:hypothetical protein
MKRRPLALIVPLLLLAAAPAPASEIARWPVPAAGLMAADAAANAPPDLKRMLVKHRTRLMEGVKAGLAASPARDEAGRRAALASGARRIAQAIRDHRRFEYVAFEAGGLVAEASLLCGPPGPERFESDLWYFASERSVFRGFTARPFDAPETLVASPLRTDNPREAFDSGVTLSARLLAWIWNAAGGDASAALARPESKGPYRVR